MTDLPTTLPAFREAYENGLTPDAMIDALLARIEEVADPAIFIHLAPREALLDAARALGPFDPGKPLWGVPFTVKDNIDVAGMPTTAACPAYAYDAREDAVVVARLRAAGAIPVGKTNLDQFATGLVGVRSPYGVPRNAVDPEIVPGGSSSGSAVSVAHGIVPFALGTDTAGSGRVPAALNGIVGLKPSLGALSMTGVVPACRTLDTVSIFARTVGDAHAVMHAAAAYDPADPWSRDIGVRPLSAVPPVIRIGVPDRLEFLGDAAQAASFRAAWARLQRAGAEIVPVDFAPFAETAALLYDGPWIAERHAVVGELMAQDPEAVLPVTRSIIGKALGLTATDAFRGLYRLAELRRRAEGGLAGLDALCVPSIPTFFTIADLEADPVGPNSALGLYTNFVNLLDLCGIAVPTGPRPDGRPGSVTLLGRAGQDSGIAAIAELLTDPAPVRQAGPRAGEIEIAVCGAHMSGLPLNRQLVDRGGRFLRTDRTEPAYGFHALEHLDPVRPGLVRRGSGGAAIDVEVWAMPAAEIGGFLGEIAAPLCLGCVMLADGSAVTGFLCEAAGAAGARDISHLGGWRAYLAETAERQRSA